MKNNFKAVFFISSSGHCNLECDYCLVTPIAKNEPSLNKNDFKFLFKLFPENTFMNFSGKGDFFAGYKKSERLLEFLLKHDIRISLDINGVNINEFAELPRSMVEKISFVNLTMHYSQLKKKQLLPQWLNNAEIIIERTKENLLLGIGTIFSPLVKDEWEESLEFYNKEIYNKTGRKIYLIKDHIKEYDADEDKLFNDISSKYTYMIERTHKDDFVEYFDKHGPVLCAAGSSFYRIWNNGNVQGCPYITKLQDSGNLKDRNFKIKKRFYFCSSPQYCDCHFVNCMRKMKRVSTRSKIMLKIYKHIYSA